MERKLNETFYYEGQLLKVVEGKECYGCYFLKNKGCVKSIDNIGTCASRFRNDHKQIKFIKVMNNKPEIKAGMLFVVQGVTYMAIPLRNGLIGGISKGSGWCSSVAGLEIDKIGYPKYYYGDKKWEIEEIIWEKPEEITITIDQIAEKFGVSADQIKIKK